MVTTFAILLSVIFILEIAAGALGLAYKKKVLICFYFHQFFPYVIFQNVLESANLHFRRGNLKSLKPRK